MTEWNQRPKPRRGILVLPTGGGKTFVATHFLCEHPLSDGYRILWLAHTHYLLEQALKSLDKTMSLVNKPNEKIRMRVVSGEKNHFSPSDIESDDNVLFCTLQTATRALKKQHPKFTEFLKAANNGNGLFVVFDEAHHAPANTYRELLTGIKKNCPQYGLLGLTATPTYADEQKEGWLKKLFSHGIIAQARVDDLMAARVLAEPVIDEISTRVEPKFNEKEYEKWVLTNRDIPSEIITNLANNKQRNDLIINHYIANKEKYGKTIIFADRWFQCESLRESLIEEGVKAGAVYSHIEPRNKNSKERNQRTLGENDKIIERFKNNELDVLINVKMLTEGIDVPDAQTVFLTRQTTSEILLKQMVGRVLRGPEFGGTDKAYIVSFIDNWKKAIDWAHYDQITERITDDKQSKHVLRSPLQMVSIDLIRRLAQQMHSGLNVNPVPYKTFLPFGWYKVKYNTVVDIDVNNTSETDTHVSDDTEIIHRPILVYNRDKFDRFIERLYELYKHDELKDFEHLELNISEELDVKLKNWQDEFFGSDDKLLDKPTTAKLLDLARHVSQQGAKPEFFDFDQRDNHDLDKIASKHISLNLGLNEISGRLRREFDRNDRFWEIMYGNFDWFKSHHDACVNRIQREQHGSEPKEHKLAYDTPQSLPENEPSDEIKKMVKEQDKECCLCCGSREKLEIDHIKPKYEDPNHDPKNLQTLCSTCNRQKGIKKIDFRKHQTELTKIPDKSPEISMPDWKEDTKQWGTEQWEMYLRRSVNFFYCCAAVESIDVSIVQKRYMQMWSIQLHPGNKPEWIRQQHMSTLRESILDGSCKLLDWKHEGVRLKSKDVRNRFAITVQSSKIKK